MNDAKQSPALIASGHPICSCPHYAHRGPISLFRSLLGWKHERVAAFTSAAAECGTCRTDSLERTDPGPTPFK